jgi:hypothetical protein
VQVASRWDALVWPKWLPVTARLPVVAQITGAVALTALVAGPWWSRIPESSPLQTTFVQQPVPLPSAVRQVTPPRPETPALPAHLNLDVRHTLRDVELSVTIDGKPALEEKLAGSGKRFKVFGRRAERGYTKTLDLAPGVHIVRVRVQSAEDKFDQTRVERFDLGSASVAALRISADPSGLSLVAERPPAPAPEPAPTPDRRATAPQIKVPAPAAVPPAPTPQPVQAAALATGPTSQEANAVVDLLHSIRSMLIWIAGFVATTATAFVFEEWLRTRRDLLFRANDQAARGGGRRRRIQSAIDAP